VVERPEREPDRGSTRAGRLSRAFVTLADTLVDDYDVIDLLDKLAHHSVDLLIADAAGIVLGDSRGQLRAVAASSQDARTMELLQLQADQGPCMDCYSTVAPVGVPDLHEVAGRWPEFASTMAGAGPFRSVHALPLRLRGRAIGVLTLFHHRPGPPPEADLSLAQALADVATIGIMQARSIRQCAAVAEQLQTALDARVVIEQAKGVIAQSLNVTMDVAFERLRRHARDHNLRLAVVARLVVDRRVGPRTLLGSPSGWRRDRASTWDRPDRR
jgi:GAF domain-containing protein